MNNAESWISARGGKWHKSVNPEPTWAGEEKAKCGASFTPLNVTHGEKPPTHERHSCAHCAAIAAAKGGENG